MYYILLVILNVFVAAIAQMLLKKGATISYSSFISQYVNIWVISGYIILGITLLINIYAMSKGVKVKEVAIIESLNYLFVPCLAYLCFKEKISTKQWIAIVLVLIGILIFFK